MGKFSTTSQRSTSSKVSTVNNKIDKTPSALKETTNNTRISKPMTSTNGTLKKKTSLNGTGSKNKTAITTTTMAANKSIHNSSSIAMKRKAPNDTNPTNRTKTSKTSPTSSTNSHLTGGATNTKFNTTTGTSKGGRRRPAWDLRGKIDDLTSVATDLATETGTVVDLTKELESQVGTANVELQQMKDRVYELEARLKAKKDQCQQAMDRLKQQHAQENRHLEESIRQYKDYQLEFDTILQDLRSTTTNLHREEEKGRQENEQMKLTVESGLMKLSEIQSKLADSTKKLQDTDSTLMEKQRISENLATQLEATMKRYHDIDSQLLKEEKSRRKLHNTLQELKGNIRVFCRMRPSLESERIHDGALAQVRFDGEQEGGVDSMEFSEQVVSGTMMNKKMIKTYSFSFDKIFTPQDGQKECFEEISQLVQSALDGYHVCIFAYGQTGSGKTFTMQGPSGNQGDSNDMGMIPRAVHQIYEVAQRLSHQGWTYTMEGQFLEIYNETIHDLLGEVSEYGKKRHDIRHEKNGKTIVTDMTVVELNSPNKVKSMLHKANQNRATGSTLLNERSSRSHSVFVLQLTGHNKTTGERTSGVLNLIDLAGSERLAASGATGDRLTETKAINKSLSCLGDVIHALARNKEGSHIPYRNSKLTYLLQNSLGGNCKTLMFVNISPLAEHFGETLCSLRFATKVNSCRIGTARKAK
ncbi:P-loop containing nucleoside triphosphate hydrolase protein [Chlamydoabsidia padenii]|nr:P-loop containing nucleoside triphosphate hydrolase protein [Chlamydoabsidia padenii]